MKTTISTSVAVCLLSIVLLPGCSDSTKAKKSATENATLGTIDDATSSAEISQEQAEQFGVALEKAIRTDNVPACKKLVMSGKIIDRIVTALDMSGKFEADFRRGMATANPVDQMLKMLSVETKKGGSYQMVRTAVRSGKMHVIFRLIGSDGSLNYHDLRLISDRGQVGADQIFIAMTGGSLTDLLVSNLGPAVRAQQSTIQKMTGEAKKKLDAIVEKSNVLKEAQAGNSDEALRLFDQLPREVQKSKLAQLGRIVASQNGPDDKYKSAIEEYMKLFPNDPSLPLVTMDGYVIAEDSEGLLRCLKQLNEWTGGDDYVNLLTASLLGQWGKVDQSKELYTNVNPASLKLVMAHNFRLTAAMECKDYPVVLTELRILRDKFEADLGGIPVAPDFAGFRESPEYQQWLND